METVRIAAGLLKRLLKKGIFSGCQNMLPGFWSILTPTRILFNPCREKNEMINNFLKPGLEDLCVSRTHL
jgi:hypothetical protein